MIHDVLHIPDLDHLCIFLCRSDPMLEDDLPDLVPTLRPYQRRAAHWMVQQEKGESSSVKERIQFFSPLCMPVDFLDTCSKMFYNPFRYDVFKSACLVKGTKLQRPTPFVFVLCLCLYVTRLSSDFYYKLSTVAMFRSILSFLHLMSLVEFLLVSPLL